MELSNATAHPKPSVAASVILSPRETKHYRRWQRLCTTLSPAQQGRIPSAAEYEDFRNWLKRQESGCLSDAFKDISGHVEDSCPKSKATQVELPIADLCQHTLHPAMAGQIWLRCPVCTIKMHLQYLGVLKQALESAGGRAPTCTLMSSEYQDHAYSAWMYGKLCALSELSRLERIAEQEVEWSGGRPQAEVQGFPTAREALELYWSSIGGLHTNGSHACGKKSVMFSLDTNFESGRPTAYFWQKSPRYEHGKHTDREPNHEEEECALTPGDTTSSQDGASSFEANLQHRLEEGESDSDDGNNDTEMDSDECVFEEIEDEANFIVFGDD